LALRRNLDVDNFRLEGARQTLRFICEVSEEKGFCAKTYNMWPLILAVPDGPLGRGVSVWGTLL
jgi:hypothetical protein